MRTDITTAEIELQKTRACLAVAWGWMIAKGADDAALQAVGYLEISACLGDPNTSAIEKL